MRHALLIILLLVCSWTLSFAEEKKVVQDKLDEVSYSLGIELGRLLAEKEMEFRPDAAWQGIYDGLRSSSPYIHEELIENTLQELYGEDGVSQSEQEAQVPQKRVTKEVVGYRLKGAKFIAENSKKEGVKSLNSGVQYKILKTGEGEKPKLTDSVLVNYKAKTVEGNVFNSSYPLGIPTPVEFKVNGLIPGLTEVLQKMQEGDKWEVYIPTRMAYKDAGPMAGQTVIYELELLEILPDFR